MILILENRYQEFGKTLWAYIREGHYTAYQKQDQGVHFYRFDTKMPGYPMRIELFSRNADFQLEEDQHIISYRTPWTRTHPAYLRFCWMMTTTPL